MADKVDAVIKVKRGIESLRRSVIFADGELAYSTDAKRLFVGDGGYGGNPTSSKTYFGSPTILTSTYAISGDFFVDTSTSINKLMVLTANDYTQLSSFALISDNTPAYTALTVVQENSAAWGIAGGAAGAAAYVTVNALSATWQSTYYTVNNNVSRWNYAADNVLAISLTFQSQSARWDATSTTVASNSSKWSSAYSLVTANSAAWGSGGSGGAQAYTTTNAYSANWNSTHSTVFSNSATWGGINGTVQTYTQPLTASGKFLVANIGGTMQAIRLWDVP